MHAYCYNESRAESDTVIFGNRLQCCRGELNRGARTFRVTLVRLPAELDEEA